MISNVKVTPAEIKKGLGFIGTLEDINIAVLDGGNRVRYSVLMPKGDFLKAMSLAGDVTEIETADDTVSITVVGEVTGKVKKGRKPAVA